MSTLENSPSFPKLDPFRGSFNLGNLGFQDALDFNGFDNPIAPGASGLATGIDFNPLSVSEPPLSQQISNTVGGFFGFADAIASSPPFDQLAPAQSKGISRTNLFSGINRNVILIAAAALAFYLVVT